MSDFSPMPVVELHKVFTTPFDNAIASARTCYSSSGIIDDSQITEKNYAIGRQTYVAGHHTVYGHAHVQYKLSNISRQFVWSFLHSHQFYNSEQCSQRYIEVKDDQVLIPNLSTMANDLYVSTIRNQIHAYQELTEILLETVEKEYLKLFPHKNVKEKAIAAGLKKKCLEVARYVLPIGTLTYMYHTISVLTLMRYYRLCNQYDCPTEQRIVVQMMVDELLRHDPKYGMLLQEPIPIEETPEFQFFQENNLNLQYENEASRSSLLKDDFRDNFDFCMHGKTSLLIDYSRNAESTLAHSIRDVMGIPHIDREHNVICSDKQAIDWALSPDRNRLLGESLNLTSMSKLSRAMVHPHYTFRKRLSHTADSQDQRHRMTPGSRPVLTAHIGLRPDYITPTLIKHNDRALSIYKDIMEQTWRAINLLKNDVAYNCSVENAAYLLPNATTIRFTESSDLMGLMHKHRMRLCYLAQEEIWQASVEEAQQVMEIHPRIGKYLLPPCTSRHIAGKRPVCPEGDRFCGVQVWKKSLSDYDRII